MKDDELLPLIYDQLYRLGLSAQYTGFLHTARAVLLAYQNPEYLTCATKWLYPEVADHYHTNLCTVERNIRYSIGILWREHPNRLCKLAGELLSKRPTPTKFIALLISELPT